jgi:hypothetical protein
MKILPVILLFGAASGAWAQCSITVTSPTNGSVMTYGWSMTATLTSCPNAIAVRYKMDGRYEGIDNNLVGGSSSFTPKNITIQDEAAAYVVAEAWSPTALLATSTVNTFRVNNTGVNATSTLDCGSGSVANGGTISGTACTWTLGSNTATLSGTTQNWWVDGVGVPGPAAPITWVLNSAIDYTTGHVTVPSMPFPTGVRIIFNCAPAAGNGAGAACVGATPTHFTAGYDGTSRYVNICGSNCYYFSLTPGGAAIIPTVGTSVSTEYTQISLYSTQPFVTSFPAPPYVIDTTYFLNGTHRFEYLLHGAGNSYNQTATVTYAAQNPSNGIITLTNHPFTQNQVVTCTGTCPAQWTGTLYVQVVDANSFGVANSLNGSVIASLSGASGTQTLTWTVPATFVDTLNSIGYAQTYGYEAKEFNVSNAASTQVVLRAKYSKIVGIAGDTFNLAPYYVCADGSVSGAGSCPSLAASHPTYSTNDAGRVTVSSTGLVTLLAGSSFDSSTTGHALVYICDTISSSLGRCAAPIDVEVRADRTTFNHLSRGFGILPNYDSAKSLVSIECFSCSYNTLTRYGFSKTLLKHAYTGMGSIINLSAIDPTTSPGTTFTDFATWQTNIWNHPDDGAGYFYLGKAHIQAEAAAIAPFVPYGGADPFCHGWQAYKLSTDVERQKAYSQMFNDLAPIIQNYRPCDEMTTKLGSLILPRWEMASGQDGLGHSTIGGNTAGLTPIVVTGCAATPCAATATFNMNSWSSWQTGWDLQVQGGTTCAALNGPIHVATQTSAYNVALGIYQTSFTATVYDVTNRTCTDAGLTLAFAMEGSDYGTMGFVSATGQGGGQAANPGQQNGWRIGATGGPTQSACATNVCTWTWTAHPFTTTGQVARVSGFGTTGLNGYWRVTYLDANSFSTRHDTVADSTYTNAAPNASGYVDRMALLPQTYVANFFTNWFTGTKPPTAGSQTGGYCSGSTGPLCASWQGNTGYTDFIDRNVTVQDNSNRTRYGIGFPTYRQWWRASGQQLLVDGSLMVNQFPDAKPARYQTQSNGTECTKYLKSSDCRVDQLPGDKIEQTPMAGPSTFLVNITPWILNNTMGSNIYQYAVPDLGQLGHGTPNGPYNSPGASYVQTFSNEVDVFPEVWNSMVNVSTWAQHEDRCLLSPLLSTPDFNTGPWSYPLVEGVSHTGSWGSCMLVVNFSEEAVSTPLDLSLINPTGTCAGGLVRWNLNQFGDSITTLSGTATSDTPTLGYAQAVEYACYAANQSALSTLSGVTVNTSAYSGTVDGAVEVHYYPNDTQWQTVLCPAGVCPSFSANLHNLDVYLRKLQLSSTGAIVMRGGMERVAAQ